MRNFNLVLPALAVLFSIAHLSPAQEKDQTPSEDADTATPPIYIKASDTESLKSKDGQKVVVYGKTDGSGKSQSGTNFVNFSDAEFYLITFKSDLVNFKDGEPADLFDGKNVAVTGVVSIYKDKPQFKLTEPDQVRILSEDEEFPPKSETKSSDEKSEKKPAAAEPTAKSAAEKPTEPTKKPPVDPKRFFK